MKRFTIILAAIALGVTSTQARDNSDDDFSMGNRLSLDFNLYDGYYSTGIGYHRMVCPWFGFGGSLGYWSPVGNNGILGDILFDYPWDDDGYYDYYDYYDTDDYDNIALYIEPSLVLRTPTLFRVRQCRFGLTALPAARLSTNSYCTSTFMKGDKWDTVEYRCDNISYSLSAALTVGIEMFELHLGYTISSLDINREYTSHTSFSRSPSHAIHFSISGFF